MSNICKTVTLRNRKIKNGTMFSFYLTTTRTIGTRAQ